jgi:hypothetical protein
MPAKKTGSLLHPYRPHLDELCDEDSLSSRNAATPLAPEGNPAVSLRCRSQRAGESFEPPFVVEVRIKAAPRAAGKSSSAPRGFKHTNAVLVKASSALSLWCVRYECSGFSFKELLHHDGQFCVNRLPRWMVAVGLEMALLWTRDEAGVEAPANTQGFPPSRSTAP